MLNAIMGMLPKSRFGRHVSILTGGTVFAQGLSVLALPVLTRLYSPEAFGLLATYMALIGLITVVSCLRLNIAIPLPEQDEDAINLLALALAATAFISMALAVGVTILRDEVALLMQQPGMAPYLWMIPVGVFLASTYDAFQYWATRRKQFVLVTRTRITRAVGGAGAQLAMGVAAVGPFGLLFGHMAYGGLGVVGLVRAFWRNDRAALKAVSIRSARATLRTYSRFPTHSLPAAIMDAGYQSIPILLMSSVIGEAQMGLIFLAIRVMAMPISLIGSSISQVYLADAHARLTVGNLGLFTRRIMIRLLGFGAPALTVMAVAAYYSSGWIFGEAFASAGTTVLWMTPWFITQLVCSPVSSIFVVAKHQGSWLALQGFGFALIVGSTIFASIHYPTAIVEIFALANFVFYSVVLTSIILLSYRVERTL